MNADGPNRPEGVLPRPASGAQPEIFRERSGRGTDSDLHSMAFLTMEDVEGNTEGGERTQLNLRISPFSLLSRPSVR
jgi:hypothetical protein